MACFDRDCGSSATFELPARRSVPSEPQLVWRLYGGAFWGLLSLSAPSSSASSGCSGEARVFPETSRSSSCRRVPRVVEQLQKQQGIVPNADGDISKKQDKPKLPTQADWWAKPPEWWGEKPKPKPKPARSRWRCLGLVEQTKARRAGLHLHERLEVATAAEHEGEGGAEEDMAAEKDAQLRRRSAPRLRNGQRPTRSTAAGTRCKRHTRLRSSRRTNIRFWLLISEDNSLILQIACVLHDCAQ